MHQAGIITSPKDVMRDLNDSTLFGMVPRLYLYSKLDAVVAADDIAAHAERAAKLGFEVRREVWEDAVHCSLPMVDAKRYWTAVEAFVSRGLTARTAKL
jgi:alpha-beta hydrolase superfamily lysophospholipase